MPLCVCLLLNFPLNIIFPHKTFKLQKSSFQLLQQLIRKFSLDLKQISHVTVLTCREINQRIGPKDKTQLHSIYEMFKTGLKATVNKQRDKIEKNKIKIKNSPAIRTTANTTKDNKCKGNSNGNNINGGIQDTSDDWTKSTKTCVQEMPRDVLIKTVQIDQFIKKHHCVNGNTKAVKETGRGSETDGGGAQWRESLANLTNCNSEQKLNQTWLEEVLLSQLHHQIVVLDLSCGYQSRQVLQLVRK